MAPPDRPSSIPNHGPYRCIAPARPIHPRCFAAGPGRRLSPSLGQIAHLRGHWALVVRFLLALGLDPATAEADAEGIEHHVSEATLAAFERLLAERGGEG